MKKEMRVYLEDILECVARIEKYTADLSYEDFVLNFECQDAVMRRLEIIGEAVKNLSLEIRAGHQDIPWKQIAGMRDILIHEYSGVSPERVWRVVAEDIRPLKEAVTTIIGSL